MMGNKLRSKEKYPDKKYKTFYYTRVKFYITNDKKVERYLLRLRVTQNALQMPFPFFIDIKRCLETKRTNMQVSKQADKASAKIS